MESTTKIRVTLDELTEITNGTLGARAISASELADGWFNTIYRIELDGGEQIVIKMAPPASHRVMRYERNLLQAEVDVLRLLTGIDGVPVPRVLAFDQSGTLHRHDFFLMEFVHGDSYGKVRTDLEPGARSAIDFELGAISARINAIAGSRFGRFQRDRCAAQTWAESILAMVDDVLYDARDAGVELPLPPETIRDAYIGARTELAEVDTPRLVVWDLHPGNVFVADGRVTGIIDCDRSLWGDPLMEYFFRSIAKTDPAFRDGYAADEAGSRLLTRPGAERSCWLYDLYLALILIVECGFRGYPQSHVDWAHSEFRRVVDDAKPGWLPG